MNPPTKAEVLAIANRWTNPAVGTEWAAVATLARAVAALMEEDDGGWTKEARVELGRLRAENTTLRERAESAERERDDARQHLRDLIARINRDGGQSQEGYSLGASIDRAHNDVAALLHHNDALKARVALLEERGALVVNARIVRGQLGHAASNGQVQDADSMLAYRIDKLAEALQHANAEDSCAGESHGKIEAGLAEELQRAYDAGLERAAVECEREARACRGHAEAMRDKKRHVSLSEMHQCAANQNEACARYIRALKGAGK